MWFRNWYFLLMLWVRNANGRIGGQNYQILTKYLVIGRHSKNDDYI
jgi:hypothetical protein